MLRAGKQVAVLVPLKGELRVPARGLSLGEIGHRIVTLDRQRHLIRRPRIVRRPQRPNLRPAGKARRMACRRDSVSMANPPSNSGRRVSASPGRPGRGRSRCVSRPAKQTTDREAPPFKFRRFLGVPFGFFRYGAAGRLYSLEPEGGARPRAGAPQPELQEETDETPNIRRPMRRRLRRVALRRRTCHPRRQRSRRNSSLRPWSRRRSISCRPVPSIGRSTISRRLPRPRLPRARPRWPLTSKARSGSSRLVRKAARQRAAARSSRSGPWPRSRRPNICCASTMPSHRRGPGRRSTRTPARKPSTCSPVELSQKTPQGISQIEAGQTMPGRGPDTPMEVSSTGTTDMHALVMFVVDATRPFSTPAHLE